MRLRVGRQHIYIYIGKQLARPGVAGEDAGGQTTYINIYICLYIYVVYIYMYR